MSYCIHCGRQTDNADYVCDECKRRKAAQFPGQDNAVQGADSASESAENEKSAAREDAAQDLQESAKQTAGDVSGANSVNVQDRQAQANAPRGVPYGVPYGAGYANRQDRQRQAGTPQGIPYGADPAGGWQPQPNVPRNGMEQGQGWQPQSNAPQGVPYGGVPYGAPWTGAYVPAPPVDRSKFPINKSGLIGMIFSIAAAFCMVIMVIIVLAFLAQNPQWLENPYYQPTTEELIGIGIACLVPILFATVFSLVGVVLSCVGLAQYKRYRCVGFAIAGLAIGGIMLLIVVSIFGGA